MINPNTCSALVLAYIGDAVYELYTRRRVLSEHSDMPAHKLHRESVLHVKAEAQSNAMSAIEELLTDREYAVYKRGRNAKSATVPKNANLIDYRRATGFEALLGYLELCGEKDRLAELMENAFNNSVKDKSNQEE